MSLIKGDRVKLTALAINRNIRPGKEKRLGTIFANRHPGKLSYAVLWDDRKTADHIHENFIERATP